MGPEAAGHDAVGALGGDLLLLDGNHRLGALALHRLAARVLAVVVLGPNDPAVLPDLAAWAGPGMNPVGTP